MSRQPRLLFLLLFTAIACGYLLFYCLDALPLRLWDEGRRAVNALEMWSGESHLLVPSFLGEPDHWGTKPPLLVWSQALAMQVLGPTVLAVRLPAALATLMTCLFLVYFSARHLKRHWAGVVAALCLVTVPFYMNGHAARSGDFDALLVLWLTVGVLYLYLFLEENSKRTLLLSAVALTLALWTKGVAALFFLPGIFLLCLFVPSYRSALTNWRVYAAVLLPMMSLVGYYLLREIYDPGFLSLLWENELGGRFSQPLEGHRGGPMFYIGQLLLWPTEQPWWLCLIVVPLLYWRRAADRPLLRYLLVLLVTHLIILTLASTKLLWYAMPQVPLYCLLLGLGFQGLLDWIAIEKRDVYTNWFAIAGLVLCLAWPYLNMAHRVAQTQHGPEYSSTTVYGGYLPTLDELATYTLLLPSYNPSAIFYAQLAQRRGIEVNIAYLDTPPVRVHPGAAAVANFPKGTSVVVCEMDPWLHMDGNYRFSASHEISPCKCLKVEGTK
ncbi:MAG: ArnT family glycosyltransferase [Lewinella sp.]|uniref:ArnT family glycosyltransferase n=1 Tax=Lewinella sp. TaxID=2004506 RepID=UPI003D6C626B